MPPPAPPTILLVEDHEDTRAYLHATLESAGYTVVVGDADEALERVRTMKVDLVVMDLGVHGEGLTIAAALAALLKPPRLMAVTGRDRHGTPAEDVFVEYLLKPVMPEDLVAAVGRALATAR